MSIGNLKGGQKVALGSFPQSDATGAKKDPVEWIVLAVEDGKALLISEKGLDCRMYHGDNTTMTWENCDLRKWLNGEFFQDAFTAEEQAVLLIDEIDKADLEFPNDLLWELDQMEFYIPETQETIRAKHRPIVIITSNAEKELPDAFLRRCVFHYIAFPDQEQMEKILRVHLPDLEEHLLAQALAAFYWVRSLRDLEKKPSTSELIDWLRALAAGGVAPERIAGEIPFAGVLLKKDKDLRTLAANRR